MDTNCTYIKRFLHTRHMCTFYTKTLNFLQWNYSRNTANTSVKKDVLTTERYTLSILFPLGYLFLTHPLRTGKSKAVNFHSLPNFFGIYHCTMWMSTTESLCTEIRDIMKYINSLWFMGNSPQSH